MARRREQSCAGEQAHCRDAVGVKIPIKNRECGARMIIEHCRIQAETRKYNDEQTDASETQSGMWHPTKKPAERCAFQRPAYRDPLAIKFDWENQRNEKESGATEERELRISGRASEWCRFEQQEEREQRRYRKCRRHEARNPVRIRSSNQLV